MKKDVALFVARCLTCQKVKIEHRRPAGLLQPLEVPIQKWDSIAMDFVTGLPTSPSGMNAIWVVVDRLTKTAVFMPIKETWNVERLSKVYIRDVVKRFGIQSDIISDRDSRFLSKFWTKLQKGLGTQLKMSTAFHPMTDEQTERTIQTLEDLL